MQSIKIYTDLSQSKVLSKILPPESADMYWSFGNIKFMYDDYDSNVVQHIPCWSLAALLDVIPKRIKEYNVLRIDISNNDFAIWYDEIGFGVNNDLPDITKESAVDACYEMVIRLNELKML